MRPNDAGTLFELIQRLEELDDRDPLNPLVIYAERGPDARGSSRALACPRREGSGPTCPVDPSLSEVLTAAQARDVVEVWASWRGGLAPSPEARFDAVMFYAQHGAYFPLETDREGM
jgi:hypothetical protein